MNRGHRLRAACIVLVVLASLALASCGDESSPPTEPPPSGSRSSCVNCHMDADLLAELAPMTPPPSGDAGEG